LSIPFDLTEINEEKYLVIAWPVSSYIIFRQIALSSATASQQIFTDALKVLKFYAVSAQGASVFYTAYE